MANRSRACFCASSLTMFIGLILLTFSFAIVAKMTWEKLDVETQLQQASAKASSSGNVYQPQLSSSSGSFGRQGQPYGQNNGQIYGQNNGQFGQNSAQPYGPSNRQPYGQNNNNVNQAYIKPILSFLDTDSTNTWILLIILLTVGMFLTLTGFICSNCAICCCTSSSSPSAPRGSVSHSVAPGDGDVKESWSDA